MTIAKKFLFGGLGMTGVASAGSSVGIQWKNDDTGVALEDMRDGQLINKVGLNCGWIVGDGSDCSIREDKKINLLIGNEKKIGFSQLPDQTGKIKVYKTRSDGYKKGLRITIEAGNIQLSKVEGENTETQTMNEFEGYEIDRREDVWYLVKRDTVEQGKIRALGLPSSCTLPTGNKTTCSISNPQIKEIELDGKSRSSFPSNTTAKLEIFKTSDTGIFGDEGYKFSFVFTQDLTISNSNVIKANTQTDFKIKKREGKLTLERAWDINKLANKVGLECNNSNVCSLKSGEKINVKQDNNKKIDITGLSATGTIKVLKDQAGYRDGLKFMVEGGDITFIGGVQEGRSGNVEKIWKDDSYQVIDSSGKYYFDRKDSGLSKKWDNLGLPSKCSSGKCNISFDELKNIRFYDRNSAEDLIKEGNPNIELNVITTGDAGFIMGKKIKIKVSNGTIKIPLNNSKYIVLWRGAEVDFRIRDLESDNPTIERSFDINAIAKQLGITGGDCEDDIGCTIGRKINVFNNGRYNKNYEVKSGFENKRIKYEIGLSGSTGSFKFILSEDIELTGVPQGFRSNKLVAGVYGVNAKFIGKVRELYLQKKN